MPRIVTNEDDEQWAPISDLMAVLMLVFMFIAIMYVRAVVNQEEVFQAECDKIYRELKAEFHNDFQSWDVELLRDLTIRFRNPEILFSAGSDAIADRFRFILEEFFPRYMDIAANHQQDIREVRIEGHTSSEFEGALDEDDAYILNMKLSQDRAYSILRFVMGLGQAEIYEWARPLIMANGLSSSHLVFDSDGREDKGRSRRVEFRLLTTSCQKAGVHREV